MIIKETAFGYLDGFEGFYGIVKMHKCRFQRDYNPFPNGTSSSVDLTFDPNTDGYILEEVTDVFIEYRVITQHEYLNYQQKFKDKFRKK